MPWARIEPDQADRKKTYQRRQVEYSLYPDRHKGRAGPDTMVSHRKPHRTNNLAGSSDQKDRRKAHGRCREKFFQAALRDRLEQDMPSDRTQEITETNNRGGQGQIARIRIPEIRADLLPVQIAAKKP